MRQRCLNPNNNEYFRYGGRGITVCEEWNSFQTFLSDMGERPTSKTLDRRDSNAPYSKANCRWATIQEQQENKRYTGKPIKLDADKVRTIRVDTRPQKEIASEYGIAVSMVSLVQARKTWKHVT